jgi:hypothetical protein
VNITRRYFFEGLAGGTVLLSLQACGGGGDSGSGNGAFGVGCNAITITSNHGHSLNVPTADLTSTGPKTYNIQGTADHNHTVTLTAQQLQDLKNGLSVTVTSATGTHTHDITTRC